MARAGLPKATVCRKNPRYKLNGFDHMTSLHLTQEIIGIYAQIAAEVSMLSAEKRWKTIHIVIAEQE